MPHKHNAERRRHIPKMSFKVQNWPAYEADLRRRACLTLWIEDAALECWQTSGPTRKEVYRAARTADTPVIRTRRPTDHRSRARRWCDTVAELGELQAQPTDWLETLPTNLQDSALAEALQAICDHDLAELQAVDPPRGFGRD